MSEERNTYPEQVERACLGLGDSHVFSLLYEDSEQDIGWTYAVRRKKYPSDAEATARQMMLLGHHIRHVAEKLDIDATTACSDALRFSEGFEVYGDDLFKEHADD